MKYFVFTSVTGDEMIVCPEEDGTPTFINPVSTNPYYQQYLEWLAEGNEPEPWNPDTINGGEE